jgi:5-formyltetrahydrofolate cyclo-ligase
MLRMPKSSIPDAALRDRKSLRKVSLAERNLQKKTTIATWSSAVGAHLLAQWPQAPGSIIGFCWPVQNEADLLPVLEEWRQRANNGQLVCALPVVAGPGQALRFRTWHREAAMVTDRYGIPTPAAGELVRPDVLLIPLNAFDAQGFRIGYGGGFFDRTLAALNAINARPLAIGVGFEIGRVADTQPQPHDERLDWIVTEAGVWKV